MAFDISSAKPVNEPSRDTKKFDINSAIKFSESGADSTIASRSLGMADAGLSFASGAANTVAGGIAGAVATPFAGAETGANIVNAFTNTIREPATPASARVF